MTNGTVQRTKESVEYDQVTIQGLKEENEQLKEKVKQLENNVVFIVTAPENGVISVWTSKDKADTEREMETYGLGCRGSNYSANVTICKLNERVKKG